MSQCIRNSQFPQKGFTLIELIIVIVILGILAVTAAPRFIDISKDANVAALESMRAAMLSAGKLTYAKSVIQGQANQFNSDVDLDGDGSNDIQVRWGYPKANRIYGIANAMDDNFETQWLRANNGNGTTLYVTFATSTDSGPVADNTLVLDTNCYLTYTNNQIEGEPMVITYETSGC